MEKTLSCESAYITLFNTCNVFWDIFPFLEHFVLRQKLLIQYYTAFNPVHVWSDVLSICSLSAAQRVSHRCYTEIKAGFSPSGSLIYRLGFFPPWAGMGPFDATLCSAWRRKGNWVSPNAVFGLKHISAGENGTVSETLQNFASEISLL